MGKLLSRYFVALLLLAGFIMIVSSVGVPNPNCEKPACSGQKCNNIEKNDCPSPCFCTHLAPGLPSSCHFCSKKACPCSNLKIFAAPAQSCCKGLRCLDSKSMAATGLGTCGK